MARAVAVPPRIHQFGLTGVALGTDLFAAATEVRYSPGQQGSLPPPAGPLRSLQIELGPPRRQGLPAVRPDN